EAVPVALSLVAAQRVHSTMGARQPLRSAEAVLQVRTHRQAQPVAVPSTTGRPVPFECGRDTRHRLRVREDARRNASRVWSRRQDLHLTWVFESFDSAALARAARA